MPGNLGCDNRMFSQASKAGCPSNCPSKTRRIARSKAVKQAHLQRERKDLGVDFQFRNQQVAGSSPAGGSNFSTT
jgi:hypothetical protein